MVWRLGLILFGFAAATLVAAVLHAPSANAQDYPSATPRAGSRSIAATTSDPATAFETPPRRLRGAIEDSDAVDIDPGEPQTTEDDASGTPPQDDRASPQDGGAVDGDISADGASDDGIIDISEPVAPEDGGDPLRDARPPEDRDVFDNPPAGPDPLLFQIEDIDDTVRTDRRPARLAFFEPYDPIGIRIGSFVFFPEAEIGGLWTNNVLSSPDARSDIAASINTTARLVSNWSRHAVELKGTTVSSFYDEFPSEDDRAWAVEARGRLDISSRTNIQGLASHSYSQEDRSAIDANLIGPRANVTVDVAELALNHRFNRLSVRLRGSVADSTYSETDDISNADRDTVETQQAVRAAWEFKPTLSVYAEQEFNQRDKAAVLPPDGIPRDSEGTRTRVGLDFGSTGAILRGTISVGYGRQTPNDKRLQPVDAFLFDANLAWRPTEITSFLLTAQSDIDDTTTQDSGGVIAHTVGLEGRHALRRFLIASAGLIYTFNDYDHTPVTESTLTSFAGIEYYASPELVLFARYQHLDFASHDLDGDYEIDEVRVGARIRK
ncbi:outer membrane beta-barrel protein [Hyphomicrobium sp.]|uniref:outer membrane beta-barrel protein n=1 Tax=Hyphomicrobium sp. TaxID=82 RepID=UPI002E37F69F|nr:outer membrane beta-barrel protein [Hyphomicrobium sp.]HEX2842951.1 outer membrane beta-barrel protein [Hyphomicrobium sp.]